MKIVQIIGGLGNQMFQYAYAMGLEGQVRTDGRLYGSYALHQGYELRRLFSLGIPEATKDETRRLTRWITHYRLSRVARKLLPRLRTEVLDPYDYRPELQRLPGPRYYEGIWQDYRYFDHMRERVLREFTFALPLNAASQALMSRMDGDPGAVSIHVRRGDYLKHKNYRGLCGVEYYRQAVARVAAESRHFYIFSNDLPWCRQHIVPLLGGRPHTMVDGNRGADSWQDMALMSACRTNIIANSSFSWWAAYLNRHPDRAVIAPERWTNGNNLCRRQHHEWIKI